MADPTRTIEVKPLTLHIGAEIAGIDLSRPLAAESRKAVSDALLKWKVVFFRGQRLDHAGHVAFARQMGEPSFLKSIVGLTSRESELMLDLLWEHVVRPEYTVRFKWEMGDIAMWDNRATAHLAPTDIFDSNFDRQLYRITLLGDVPVGVDGRPSVALKGEPIRSVETELTAAAG